MRDPTFTTNDPHGEGRFKELILYIAAKCASDQRFGATKLNKILWRADFVAYAQLGQPITGVEYMRLRQGPVPRRLLPLQEQLIDEGRAAVASQTVLGGYTRKVTVPLADPDLSLFTADQIAIVDAVIDEFSGMSAAQVSNISHGKAWQIIADGDLIPYETVFLADQVTKANELRVLELCKEHGWG